MTRKRARKILMSMEDKRRCGIGHAGDQTVREAAAGKNGGQEEWKNVKT